MANGLFNRPRPIRTVTPDGRRTANATEVVVEWLEQTRKFAYYFAAGDEDALLDAWPRNFSC